MTQTITTAAPKSITKQYHSVASRQQAIRNRLIDKERAPGVVYTDTDIDSLLDTPLVKALASIDDTLLQDCADGSPTAQALDQEIAQFKMRLDYLETILTMNTAQVSQGLITRRHTLAVVGVEIVPRQLGQTLTIATDIAAPLWTRAEQAVDTKTTKIRSTFRAGLNAYTAAEELGFFEGQYTYDKPLLIQGTPTVLANGDINFVITDFSIGQEQSNAIRKTRREAEAAAAAEALRIKRELAAAKREAKALEREEKARLKKEKALAKAAAKKTAPRQRKTASPKKAVRVTSTTKATVVTKETK